MAEILDYYAPNALSALYYDLVARHDSSLKGEVDFYADLIPRQSWVLEVGAGSGRITIPLAERDYAVVGLDNSPVMLQRAGARHEQLTDPDLKARTGFVQGDMRRFELNNEFDAVIAPFFGFSHLPAGAHRQMAMRAIARHLKPGGIAAIHAVLPATIAASAPIDPVRPVLNAELDESGRRLAIYMRAQGFEAATGRFEQILDYVVYGADGVEEQRSPERLVYFVSDLEADALGSGLILQRKISPFNDVGEMWVFERKA
jgi:SAM-dependent methyltransferase